MRILDRYSAAQLFPVSLWCLSIFLFLSCLIDLFGHLDEILRYKIAVATVVDYYLQFLPIVFVKAAPFAALLSSSFVAMRMARYQELLALSASGTSPARAAMPFLFVGWLLSLSVFAANEWLVPRSSIAYGQMREEVFKGPTGDGGIANAAVMDDVNRLYHARSLNPDTGELSELTVIEHDEENRPTRSVYASRAVWTAGGWLLHHGTIYRAAGKGGAQGEPQPFVERLMKYPVTPDSFTRPQSKPENMRYEQLNRFIGRLKQSGWTTNLRGYQVELASKLSLPFMCLVAALIAFVHSTKPQLRGTLRGLGISLTWGLAYYMFVGVCQALTKLWPIPIFIGVWMPHVLSIWWCFRTLQTRTG